MFRAYRDPNKHQLLKAKTEFVRYINIPNKPTLGKSSKQTKYNINIEPGDMGGFLIFRKNEKYNSKI